jgi:hypothetical protein
MSAAGYLIGSALLLLVLIQIKERKLTTISLIRPSPASRSSSTCAASPPKTTT